MIDVEVRRPQDKDMDALRRFFSVVVHDTFAKEGLADLAEDIEREIDSKIRYLNMDLETGGENRYFMIGFIDRSVVGTIEFGPSNSLIRECSQGELNETLEIGTVFVHPDYQGHGIGNLLLNVIYLTLLNKGITEFCLDSGYVRAQQIWKKKFGKPDYVMPDYWGTGVDHMIWRRSISEVPIVFRNVG